MQNTAETTGPAVNYTLLLVVVIIDLTCQLKDNWGNPRPRDVDSSPTSGALIAVSYEDLNNLKEDKCNDNLQKSSQSQDISTDQTKEAIRELIDSICKYQKSYVKNSLGQLLEKSPKNTETICKYIITEQNEINIKELTKEGKIKTLINITRFLDYNRHMDLDR